MKIGIYTRVSRDDGTQNPENQVQELRGWAERLGGTVVAEYGPEVRGDRGAARAAGSATGRARAPV